MNKIKHTPKRKNNNRKSAVNWNHGNPNVWNNGDQASI
jgi:hypothetical protein